uniref:Zmp:0000000924 n=1 Tax=Cyprinus carpio TaxID=7962 RepID=A0A8C1UEQ9_CYPCA
MALLLLKIVWDRKTEVLIIFDLTLSISTLLDAAASFTFGSNQWIFYQFSFYYMSNETKNWTESRQDCLKKEADLIIINSSEEQNNTVNREFWIGVNDSDVEGRWKWVDGSNLTSGFWASREPNGGREENCAVTYLIEHPTLLGWLDVKCNNAYQWICEKSILPFIE